MPCAMVAALRNSHGTTASSAWRSPQKRCPRERCDFSSDQERARALRPLAVLRQQMPLLRLQQPCPGGNRPGCVARRACSPTSRTRRGCCPDAADLDLLRRRNALADGSGDGRSGHCRGTRALGPRRTTSRSRSRPTPIRSRRRASPISRGGRQPPLARAAELRRRGARLPRPRAFGARRPRALEIAQTAFRRVSFDLIYALPGDTKTAGRATLGAGALASAPRTCRSTS